MKLTVVGYWGAYPEQGEATSCYLLEKDNFCLMLDCGSGVLSRLPFYQDINNVDAVVLSHYHQDHIADIGVLQYNRLVQNSLQGTDHLLPIYGHEEDKEKFENLTHHATKGEPYDPTETLTVGPFQLTFFKTVHPVLCYGMKMTDGVHTVVYTADTAFSKDWIPFCQEADLLVAECSFYRAQNGSAHGHMNSEEAAVIAEEAEVKELILTHLPHFGEHQSLKREAKKTYNGKIHLAKEGLIWQKN